jgi:hypothetical protein
LRIFELRQLAWSGGERQLTTCLAADLEPRCVRKVQLTPYNGGLMELATGGRHDPDWLRDLFDETGIIGRLDTAGRVWSLLDGLIKE